MTRTSTGLQENVAGLLCYVLAWISAIIFLILEKDNKFVRFHAYQSLVVFGSLQIIGLVFTIIPVLGVFISWVISVLSFILWVVLIVKAAQGFKYKLPIAGDIAERWANK
ncbi:MULTISPECIES: DUF4870 domain-containing protein [Dehalococcoides]|jgi:uncharacterized membrane protein|uniref:DUF4870 domain-containing protein n=1 Tax=Dehalococcoides TaxID=61434 RepID=UPI0003C807C0|nr:MULTISPECIES: DUF4870 domain-containing protein [Dehalococcoides]AHB13433.1 hypothetical protein GY50_0652 [Dehalococcoides mccartyi GY50]AII57856.1 membrane protein [Dehalococcoides mccartyi CG1]APH12332.1 hypothetical protein ASJ33_03755 [Dehalococcoides mccartyi]QYY58097.1 DUF4870 domain-containing protein [Dehalococcoides mccartyi]BAQ34599.1 putative membrane protein [Dehalococcoides sp. UCH007]